MRIGGAFAHDIPKYPVIHQSVDDSKRDVHDTYQDVREGEIGVQYVGDILSFSLLLKDDNNEREVSKKVHD